MRFRRRLFLAVGGLLLAAGALALAGLSWTSQVARQAAGAHPMDASKRSEHEALLNLMPDADLATHVARQSGSWADSATWANDDIPGEGAIVFIPPGMTVTYDSDSSEHLFLIRVDGSLQIEARAGVRPRMIVDTLFTAPAGGLIVDADDPGAGDVIIDLIPFDIEAYKRRPDHGWGAHAAEFYSDGAVVTDTGAGTRPVQRARRIEDGPGVIGRYRWDPLQLSLGLIVHGSARISGKPKRSRAPLAGAAPQGAAEITLADEPEGWEVGDQIALTGVRYVGRDLATGAHEGSQDEIRTITEILGARISLDRPLEFDHDPHRAGLDRYAANLTRNVRFSGGMPKADRLDAKEVSSSASRLGHVMFMHNEDVRVRYAAFDGLGRTNKADVVDDFRRSRTDELNAGRTRVDGLSERLKRQMGIGVPQTRRYAKTEPEHLTNPRGRYAVHLHRAGATADDQTALVEGCVVTGGPGWGFVSHDSRADFLENIAFGVLGASFVAETGNETGLWDGNIAINTYGADFNQRNFDPSGLFPFENNDINGTILLEKRGAWKNHDFGRFGVGFWLQGKLIDMRDNVSASSGLAGFFYMFRAADQINVAPSLLEEPLTVHSPNGVHPFAPGLNVFTGNQSIADSCGLAMIGIGGGRTNDERSVIADFTAWEVGQIGSYAEYYPGYTIKDSTFIASDEPSANPSDGILWNKVQIDTVLAHLEIEGFPQMYDLRKSWSPGARDQQGFADPYEVIAQAAADGLPNPLPLGYAHVLIEPGFSRAEAAKSLHLGSTYREEDVILTSDDLRPGTFAVRLDDDSLRINLDNKSIPYGWLPNDPVRPTLQEGHVLLLEGTKTDSIGSIPINYLNNVLVWHEDAVQQRLDTEGYFRMPNGSKGVILEEVFADRYTAEKRVVRFVAELDPRWDLRAAVNLGEFVEHQHPAVYVPRFLLDEDASLGALH